MERAGQKGLILKIAAGVFIGIMAVRLRGNGLSCNFPKQ
jgi:hypothetical protein